MKLMTGHKNTMRMSYDGDVASPDKIFTTSGYLVIEFYHLKRCLYSRYPFRTGSARNPMRRLFHQQPAKDPVVEKLFESRNPDVLCQTEDVPHLRNSR